jgi:penicillin-binding protein 1C
MHWRLGYWLILIILSASLLLMLDHAYPPSIERAGQTSPLILDANNRILRGFIVNPGVWRLPTTVSDVDPLYLTMLLAYEDRRFAHTSWRRSTGGSAGAGPVVAS